MLRNTLLHDKRSLSLALAFVLCSSLPAYAAQQPPNAGTIADSVKEKRFAFPPKANVQVEVSGDQTETQPTKEGQKFHVNGFSITGISAINELALREDKLQDLIKDETNKDLTLSELQAVARRIAKYFREQGYMVANAYIPPQKIEEGIVEIAVVPGKYDSIELHNHSRLSDSTAHKLLSSLKVGNYVKKDKLDRTLLLISDTGGIAIKANLKPGTTTGTSTLVVDISSTDALTADLSTDNYGNRFTGKDLRNLDLDAHNVSGVGDQLRVHANNSGGGMTNAGIDYVLPIGGQGFKLGVGYEHLYYTLGEDFQALDAHGTARDTTVYGSYPLVRSRNYNLYAQIGYTHKQLEDRIDTQDYLTDRHANVWTLGLNGDSRDKFHGGGVNSFALTVARGHLTIDGGQDSFGIPAQTSDANGPNTAGSFTKTNLDFNRLQHVSDHVNAYIGFSGQLASKNLDNAEKFFLGGANGVRAYPQGEASGDEGYLLTAELRYQTSNPSLQLVAFIDHGYVNGAKNYFSSAAVDRSLTGAGIGAIFTRNKQYTLRFDYAWKLTSDPAISDDDKKGRFWLRGIRYFE